MADFQRRKKTLYYRTLIAPPHSRNARLESAIGASFVCAAPRKPHAAVLLVPAIRKLAFYRHQGTDTSPTRGYYKQTPRRSSMGFATFSAISTVLLTLNFGPSTADVVSYDWRVTAITAAFDGVSVPTLGINDKPGDQALIDVELG
ncbi:ferroxidase fet3 [Phytophthora pseudosyringae]|uniref:Ferroxidase fet3 n=1 Tax=Phytophthora pseudosyringae TaxID=221518 RepID=A0A8T1VNS1_9STRA|nr:ferroxidase fet3 [Phytophthora pseudosyringae]